MECIVVNTLTSPVVLGIDWLSQHSPHIDWSNYTAGYQYFHCHLTGSPAGSDVCVELCSSKALVWEVQHDAIAWFALILESTDASSMELTQDPLRNRLHGASSLSDDTLALQTKTNVIT